MHFAESPTLNRPQKILQLEMTDLMELNKLERWLSRRNFLKMKMWTSAKVDVAQMVKEDEFLELLPPNSHKMTFPVRCLACFRKGTQKHAIFDLCSMRSQKWLKQHREGSTHVGNGGLEKNAQEQW